MLHHYYPYVLAVIAMLIVVILVYRRTQQEVGFGWVLRWENGEVYVRTRLNHSPAGEAGVLPNNLLLQMDGVPLYYASEEEFQRRFPQDLWGRHAYRFEIKQGQSVREVTLRPRLVDKRIPVYTEVHASTGYPIRGSGPIECPKTGVIHTNYSLCDDALER